MRFLRLSLTTSDAQAEEGQFQVELGGEAGQVPRYSTVLPFFARESGQERRRSLLKILGAVQFREQDFQAEELSWMDEVGLLVGGQYFSPQAQTIIGQAIYRSLFPDHAPAARDLLNRSLGSLNSQEKLHLQIGFMGEGLGKARLPDYPWELAHDGRQFLAKGKVVFSRFISMLETSPQLPSVKEIRLLLVSSTAADGEMGLEPLVGAESAAIVEALQTANRSGMGKSIQVKTLDAPTFKQFGDYLLDCDPSTVPHVIHFDGHGFFGKRCNHCRTMHKKVSDQFCRTCQQPLDATFRGYLLFSPEPDSSQAADYCSADEIAEELRNVGLEQDNRTGLRLVVMSACKTGMAVGGDSVFNGLAPRLIQEQIPAVVAMQHNVTVRAARDFSERFYRSLRQGQAITTAMRMGQARMGEGNQWYRPVLYLRWQDNEGGQLFATTAPLSPTGQTVPAGQAEPSAQPDQGSNSGYAKNDTELSSVPEQSCLLSLDGIRRDQLRQDYDRLQRQQMAVYQAMRTAKPALKVVYQQQLEEMLKRLSQIETELRRLDESNNSR